MSELTSTVKVPPGVGFSAEAGADTDVVAAPLPAVVVAAPLPAVVVAAPLPAVDSDLGVVFAPLVAVEDESPPHAAKTMLAVNATATVAERRDLLSTFINLPFDRYY